MRSAVQVDDSHIPAWCCGSTMNRCEPCLYLRRALQPIKLFGGPRTAAKLVSLRLTQLNGSSIAVCLRSDLPLRGGDPGADWQWICSELNPYMFSYRVLVLHSVAVLQLDRSRHPTP